MRDDRERLLDIVEAADRVAELVSRGKEPYENDAVLQDAMIRRLEVIGEAAARLSDETRGEHPDVPWRQAAALRNRTAHGYFDVDLEQLWTIASRDAPGLAAQVREILNRTG